MDPRTLLGTTFDCACGRQHTVPTRALYYSDDAFDHLLPIIEGVGGVEHCLIIADCRTYAATGQLVEEKLRQGLALVELYIIPDCEGEPPVADDQTKDLILDQAPNTDLFIAVGSGVVNDLVKWVAFLRSKPYICVATAASMNGYASANVAASIDGLKVLFHAKPCLAIFSTPEILRNAPFNLTASGLGDVDDFRVIFSSPRFPTSSFGYAHNLHPDLVKKIVDAFYSYRFTPAMQETFGGADRFFPVTYLTS